MSKRILFIAIIVFVANINSYAQPRKYRDGSTAENPADLFSSIEELIKSPTIFKSALIETVGKDYQPLTASEFIEQIKASNSKLGEYSQKVDAFLASRPKEAFYTYEVKTAVIKSKKTILINQIEKNLKAEKSIAMVYHIQELEIYKVYAENMIKIYPNEQKLKDNLNEIVAAQKSFGNAEQFMSKMQANEKKYTANLKMDPPAIQDKGLEQFVKNAYQKKQMDGLQYEVTKVNITRSMWTIEKNELDIPTYKWISACMAIKTNDGKCGIATTYIRKDYEGGGAYGEPFLHTPTSITILPCENLK